MLQYLSLMESVEDRSLRWLNWPLCLHFKDSDQCHLRHLCGLSYTTLGGTLGWGCAVHVMLIYILAKLLASHKGFHGH